MHVTSSHHLAFSQQLTPYLEQVLDGIQKEQVKSGTNCERLPITVDLSLMQQIYSVWLCNIQE